MNYIQYQKGILFAQKNELPKPKYDILVVEEDLKLEETIIENPSGIYGIGTKKYDPFLAPLIKHIRLTPLDHWQDVRHLTFDITSSNLTYEPGDVLLLHPTNDNKSVRTLCDLFGISNSGKNQWIKMKQYKEYGIPSMVTVFDLFKKYLDINGTPRRTFFERLINFTDNEQHKEKLTLFSKPEGQMALYEYNEIEKRTYVEVLNDFKTCIKKMNLSYLTTLIPKLKPRKFSIASCMEYYYNDQNCIENNIPIRKNEKRKLLEIVVALVEYKTPLKRQKYGICSSFIKSFSIVTKNTEQNFSMPIWIEKGSFRMPKEWLSTKAIFIGPGTGIAPFRSMAQHRYYLLNDLKSEKTQSVLVFFGNRNKDKDYFYQREWMKLQSGNENRRAVFKFLTAFSRDQKEKIYVQHELKKYGELVWNWIHQEKCYIFIAGSSLKMPRDVKQALIYVIGKYGKMNSKEAEIYLNNMEKKYRFQSETWS